MIAAPQPSSVQWSAKRPTPTQAECLAWLAATHPQLHPETDRSWIWITDDLRQDKATRDSIRSYGFRFSGKHPLAGGSIGTWGHSCKAPTPYKGFRKRPIGSTFGKSATGTAPKPQSQIAIPQRVEEHVSESMEDVMARAMAILSS